MNITNMKNTKKIIIIISISIIIFLLVFCLASYCLIKNYINKINLVSVSEQQSTEQGHINEDDLEPEPEDVSSDTVDSPEEAIQTIEAMIRKNMEGNQTPIISD